MNSFNSHGLIGNSPSVLLLLRQIQQVAPSNAPVLIHGESGTGKQFVAEAIRRGSTRARKKFIAVSCSALSEDAAEYALFGRENGEPAVRGAFEEAQGGTVFLDEIASLFQPTQIKLSHVLEERAFERCGGNTSIHFNARLLAATSQPLEQLVRDGRFYDGLYYRLNVFPLHIPPLRERKQDIPLLARHFMETFNSATGKNVWHIATSALEILMNYSWPDNIRELKDCIELASMLSTDGVIRDTNLPLALRDSECPALDRQGVLKTELEMAEKELILNALKACGGNVSAAARRLGLTKRMMGLRLRKYRIDSALFKQPRSKKECRRQANNGVEVMAAPV